MEKKLWKDMISSEEIRAEIFRKLYEIYTVRDRWKHMHSYTPNTKSLPHETCCLPFFWLQDVMKSEQYVVEVRYMRGKTGDKSCTKVSPMETKE